MPPGLQTLACPLCGGETAEHLGGLHFIARAGYLRCTACRCLFAPVDPSSDQRFYEEVYPDLPHKAREDAARRPIFLHALERLERSTAGRRVLDVGCGQGEFIALARSRGWEAVGVEVSETQARRARERSGAAVLVGAPEVAAAHGPFHLVTLWNVLDQVPDPLSLLRSARTVLADGGDLVVRIPNGAFHAPLMRLVAILGSRSERLGLASLTPLHPWVLGPSHLRAMLGRAGFVTIALKGAELTHGDSSRPPGSLAGRLVSLGKRSLGLLTTLLELVSAGRLVLGPSIEALARKRELPS